MPRTRQQRPIEYRDRQDRVWSVSEVAVLKVVSPAIDGSNLALVIRFEEWRCGARCGTLLDWIARALHFRAAFSLDSTRIGDRTRSGARLHWSIPTYHRPPSMAWSSVQSRPLALTSGPNEGHASRHQTAPQGPFAFPGTFGDDRISDRLEELRAGRMIGPG